MTTVTALEAKEPSALIRCARRAAGMPGGLHQGLRGSELGSADVPRLRAYGPVDQTSGDQPSQHGRDDQEDDPQRRERHDLGQRCAGTNPAWAPA